MSQKVQAARLSVGSNTLLVVAKVAIGLLTGSVSVVSEAIHSGMDLIAAVIALASVRIASRPADEEHRYGHGKVENLSALVEGALILLAAAWIIVEALGKLRTGHEAPAVGAGLVVMGLSSAVNWFVSAHLLKVARSEESAALEADAMHLRTDVWTSVGVFAGLLLVKVTGIPWLDPVVAIGVALMIVKAGYQLCREALTPLVDGRLPGDEESEIIHIIERHSASYVEFHDLRTRRAGSDRHVDFHLVTHGTNSLEEVHRVCDEIEQAILERFPNTQVLIHPEPCGEGCAVCQSQGSGAE